MEKKNIVWKEICPLLLFYSFCSSLLCQLPCRTDLCWGRKLNNLHVLIKNCNINRSLVMKIIFWLSIPLWLPNMCSCWFSVYSILTLLKKFQFNMSDTEVGICQCLYFKTQISLFKTRPKKSVIAGMWIICEVRLTGENSKKPDVDWKIPAWWGEKRKRTNSIYMFATFLIEVILMCRFRSSISESLLCFAWTIL